MKKSGRQPTENQPRLIVQQASLSFLFSFSLLLSAATSTNAQETALAANPAGKPTTRGSDSFVNMQKELKNIESRYFFHTYDHDPVEKRLERLELLVFGTAQFGVNEERFAQLKVAIQKHDRESAAMMKQEHSHGPKKEASSKGDEASYPILTTLEWKVLRKTFKNESMDQRLDRLETTLLGKASPAMSYFDRIERISKIVGVPTSTPPVAEKTFPQGPLPRAGGGARDPRSRAFSFGPRTFMSPMPNDDSTFEEDFQNRAQKDLSQIFKFMDQRFGDMFQGMPRTFPFVPEAPDGNEATPHSTPSEDQEIPPYADPNSI